MATFVLVNRAPKNYTASADALAAYNAWFAQLGANLVDRGNPVFDSRTLGNSGADTTLGGYTLIHADDLEAAVALAKGHPLLRQGGGVEVGELTLLNQGTRQIVDDPA
jgi:YCII-related domain